MQSESRLDFILSSTTGKVSLFAQILQHGFVLRTRAGCSVGRLLAEELGLGREYIENCIQTIFLDGRPVDNIDSAMVKDGATLALSAAMPGLVGATMRCGGYYASLRSGISYRQDQEACASSDGTVVLKLFNLVADDLGPRILEQGIWVKRESLEEFFRSRPENFWKEITRVRLNEREMGGLELLGLDWSRMDEWVRLRVQRQDAR